MGIYILLLFYSAITGFFCFTILQNKFSNTMLRKLYCITLFIPLSFVAGVRNYTVGSDTAMYYGIFKDIQDVPFSFSLLDEAFNIELGYRAANYLVGCVSHDPAVFMYIFSTITIAGYMYFFYRESKNIWLTIFLFIGLSFYTETFNSARQQFACVILCLGTKFLLKNDKIRWNISVVLAMLFHVTAAFFFIFNFIMPISKKKVLWFTAISIIGFVFSDTILSYITLFYPDFKYGYYLASENINNASLGDYLRALLFSVILLYFVIKNKRFLSNEDNSCETKRMLLWSVFLLYATLFIIAKQQFIIFYRMIQYFSLYLCLLLPALLSKTGLIKYQICFLVLILTPVILTYLTSINPDLYYTSFLLDWF